MTLIVRYNHKSYGGYSYYFDIDIFRQKDIEKYGIDAHNFGTRTYTRRKQNEANADTVLRLLKNLSAKGSNDHLQKRIDKVVDKYLI
jgi:hypothetical protein